MDSKELKKFVVPSNVGAYIANEVVTCKKVIYSSGDFFIFVTDCGFTVKGLSNEAILKNLTYKISGEIVLHNLKAQIDASSIEKIDDNKSDEAVMAALIEESFEGIGSRIASSIANHFGDKSLEVLKSKPKEAAAEISGLSLKKAKEISAFIEQNESYLIEIYELMKFGLTFDNSKKAIEKLGHITPVELKKNPFILLKLNGFGFESCDKLAKKYELDSMCKERFAAAIESSLSALHINTGSTYLTADTVQREARKLLDVNCSADEFKHSFEAGIEYLTDGKRINVYHFNSDGKCEGCSVWEKDSRLALSTVFRCEVNIKREVENFLNAPKPYFDKKNATEIIREAAKRAGIELHDRQEDALLMCLHEPLCIITGGPGTGKTTITGILADHFRKQKISCVYCAPTGRAAKRLSDAIGVHAGTIHKLLEIRGGEENPADEIVGKGPSDPIDARVIVVDEASMVDVRLFKLLLFAIKKNASLILIGDPNQLPSVGPGNLLSDLLSCKAIPRVELQYIYRQGEGSSIAENAYNILNNQGLITDKDFEIIHCDNEEEAREQVLDKYRECVNEFGLGDTAVLSPTRHNLMGTVSLNEYIQNNEADPESDSIRAGEGVKLFVHDRVMQIKNNYTLEFKNPDTGLLGEGVFNGELGSITDIDEVTGKCEVLFDDLKKVTYSRKTIPNLDLAYAMTVHKSQGCEFDNVLISLGKMSPLLYSKKLLYTAVTRGKKKVIIIDSNGMLDRFLRSRRETPRNTSLSDFLCLVDKRNETP